MMRVIRWVLGALAVVAITFAVAATWLIATAPGARTVGGLATEYLPIRIGGLEGSLKDGLRIARFEYDATGARILGDHIELTIDLWSFLDLRAVRIERLRAGAIVVLSTAIAEDATTSSDATISLPGLPVVLDVVDAQVDQLTLNEARFANVSLKGRWDANEVSIAALQFSLDEVNVEAAATISTDQEPRFTATIGWRMPTASGRLDAQGTQHRVQITHVAHLEGNELTSQGTIDASQLPMLKADFEHDLPFPGLALTTVIFGSGSNWDLGIRGRYDQWPFDAKTTLTSNEDRWSLSIAVSNVANAIKVTGEVELTPELRGTVQIEGDQLAELLPGLEGQLAGFVEFDTQSGTGGFRFGELSFNGIVATGGELALTVPLDPQGELAADLSFAKVTSSDIVIDSPRMQLNGPLQALRYNLSWPGTSFSGDARIVGDTLYASVAAGSQLSVGDLSMRNNVMIELQKVRAGWQMSSHCWEGFATVCVDEAAAPDQNAIVLTGSAGMTRLERLNPWLPLPLTDGGRAQGTWTLRKLANGWTLDTSTQLTSVAVAFEDQSFHLPNLTISGQIGADATKVAVQGANDELELDARVNVKGTDQDAEVDGRVQAAMQLSALPSILADLGGLAGELQANAMIGGSLSNLLYDVSGDWTAGAFAWNDPEIKLKDIQADWAVDQHGWNISGLATPEQGGSVSIKGSGDGFSANATVDAEIAGHDIELASDFWEIIAAPDIKLDVREGAIEFAGSIDVPRARIEIETLPESLPRPSPDVRVIGREVSTDQQKDIAGRVAVRLGDDVRLKLFVLDIGLTGELAATVKGDEVTELTGDLDITAGSLKASGQTLAIEEGQVTFSGDPVNPYVDIVATRDIEEQSPPLKVGLRVVGPSDALETTVYSEPAMSETRALSFLVLGRDFNERSESDSNQLISAALGFGLRQSQGVIQDLRSTLRLDELSALAADQNDVAIVAGKRVTNDLYVRYSYNALSAVGALVIRYHLTDRWRLEATNDATSSMDLLYEFTK
jgi:translocation and assembly module TamB